MYARLGFFDVRAVRQLALSARDAGSLETQCEQGAFVHRLIALAESLLLRVREVSASRSASGEVQTWFRRPMRTEVFFEGIQAIDWTVEERGLAGLSALEGNP